MQEEPIQQRQELYEQNFIVPESVQQWPARLIKIPEEQQVYPVPEEVYLEREVQDEMGLISNGSS